MTEPGYSGDKINDPKEVERKFIIDASQVPSDLEVVETLFLIQGYVAIADDGSETRVRMIESGDPEDPDISCELTVKSKGTLVRGESPPVFLTVPMAAALMSKIEGDAIEKVRQKIPCGDNMIELDTYHRALEGLSVAEVEFYDTDERTALQASMEFVPPVWFGAEVTEDLRFKNQSLALEGNPLIEW